MPLRACNSALIFAAAAAFPEVSNDLNGSASTYQPRRQHRTDLVLRLLNQDFANLLPKDSDFCEIRSASRKGIEICGRSEKVFEALAQFGQTVSAFEERLQTLCTLTTKSNESSWLTVITMLTSSKYFSAVKKSTKRGERNTHPPWRGKG